MAGRSRRLTGRTSAATGPPPFVAYLPLAPGAGAAWLAPAWSADLIGASLLALLLIAIRNAWDLVTWISAKASGA